MATSWFIPGFIQTTPNESKLIAVTFRHEIRDPEPSLQHSLPQDGQGGSIKGQSSAHQHVEHHPHALWGEKKRIFSSVPSSQQGFWRCKASPATERILSCRKRGLRWKGGSCTLGGSWELNPTLESGRFLFISATNKSNPQTKWKSVIFSI